LFIFWVRFGWTEDKKKDKKRKRKKEKGGGEKGSKEKKNMALWVWLAIWIGVIVLGVMKGVGFLRGGFPDTWDIRIDYVLGNRRCLLEGYDRSCL